MKIKEFYNETTLYFTTDSPMQKIGKTLLWLLAFPIMATIQLNHQVVYESEKKRTVLFFMWFFYVSMYLMVMSVIFK